MKDPCPCGNSSCTCTFHKEIPEFIKAALARAEWEDRPVQDFLMETDFNLGHNNSEPDIDYDQMMSGLNCDIPSDNGANT